MNNDSETIFKLCAKHDATGDIDWDEDFNIWINCSDFIALGSDSEEIKDIPLFEKCLKDAGIWGAYLYVLRVNKCLPHPAKIDFFKKHLPKEIWMLFKQAGKE